jgi:DNA-binding winged helix-turn-helix (wHTH) protein
MANDGIVQDSILAFGPFRLLPRERRLEREQREVKIGSRALEILVTLAECSGDVVSKEDLTARVWPDTTVHESGLRVHIAALRKALGDGQGDARYVTNVPGRGYCFVAPVVRSSAGAARTDVPRAHDQSVATAVAHALLEELDTNFVAEQPSISKVQSFVDRAAAAAGKLSQTREDAALIAQICRRLDGIARAIRFAATVNATTTP